VSEAELHREEWIEERAGILEFEAKYPRVTAERLALAQWADYAVARGLRSAKHG
jgi:hypothetical protein